MKMHSIISVILVAFAAAQAAPPTIYPTPHKAEFPGGTTRVKKVEVVYVECETAEGETAGQGYSLTITPGKLVVEAEDEDALFYAKQTLSQMLQGVPGAQDMHKDPFPNKSLEEVAKMGELPLGEVVDKPDLPYRGVVEGYYGAPWSREMRVSQFAFYGRNKMNTYIYAPKDDPYHHGQGCYKPYPEEKAAEIRELVKIARKNHVHFVWGIHPANTVKWQENGGRNQLDALCAKLQMMYDLGVRDFAVLVDDSSGEIGKPERQVQLSNYLLENFIHKHPDVNQTLIMCPTGYNRSWTNPWFLRTLGEGLHKDIPVMWTGNTVVNDITHESQTWVSSHLQRPTFVWWNWPCSDFKRSRLSMGRTYGMGQEPDMKKLLSGFVANPMEQAEACKVGLFGVANYTWNITAFDSDRTWKDGIKLLYPKDAAAMQVFCNHNSYLLPNNHGFFREESVEVAPVVKRFVTSLESDAPNKEDMAAIRAEFAGIESAGKRLSKSQHLGALKAEIAPWLEQFTLTGHAGVKALDALAAKSPDKKLASFFEAMESMAQMRTITRTEWNNGNLKPVADVEVAMLVMTPALQSTCRYLNRSVYSLLAGRPSAAPVFTTNRGNPTKDRAALDDGNPRTFWSNDGRQQVGDWVCLDFGEPIDLRRVNLLMGGARAGDYALAGQFEISDDGTTWQPLGEECNGPAAVLNLTRQPARARMLRFRITRAQQRWLAIYDFSVNRLVPPYVTSNLSSHTKLTANQTDKNVSINRVMEVFPIRPGEFIDLEIPALVTPGWVEINLENADLVDWADVKLTLEDGRRVPVRGEVSKNRLYVKDGLPKAPVSSLRLTNISDTAREIKITLFRIGTSPEDVPQSADLLTDNDLSTFISCDSRPLKLNIPLPKGTRELIVVGTADCEVKDAVLKGRDSHTQRFRLPKGVKTLQLTAPVQKGKFISELIFK